MNVQAKTTVPCISCQSECEQRSAKKKTVSLGKASRAHGRWMMPLCCVESYLSESWIINRGEVGVGGVGGVLTVLIWGWETQFYQACCQVGACPL